MLRHGLDEGKTAAAIEGLPVQDGGPRDHGVGSLPGLRALGDFQEDAQLQEAARQLLEKVGVDIRTVAEFKDVLKIDFEEDKKTEAKGKGKKG